VNRLVLTLTDEQAEQVQPFMAPGVVWLGRIQREGFDAALGNGETCGRWVLECGSVAESALPALRLAIQRANK